MLSKNDLKRVSDLRIKKWRDETGCFAAEGQKMVGELMHSDLKIREIYGTEKWLNEHPQTKMKGETRIVCVSETELGRLSAQKSPNEVIAVCSIPRYSFPKVLKGTLNLYFDHISDPGNMGTLVRLADWFGIQEIYCSPGCVDFYSSKVIQAGMGAVSRIRCFKANLTDLLPLCMDIEICGAVLNGENLYKANFKKRQLLVLGNESSGISQENLGHLARTITIPPRPGYGSESLNVAVAGGIIMSELLRTEIKSLEA